MQQTRQTMLEMQSVLRMVERELPDTAAAVRLSGLELSDAIEEVSLLRRASCHPVASTGILLSHMMTMLHMHESAEALPRPGLRMSSDSHVTAKSGSESMLAGRGVALCVRF